MMRAKLSVALSALAVTVWAVPNAGAARFIAPSSARESRSVWAVPQSVRFRMEKERGILVRAWINGSGPYLFALDTGAGLNVITERVVAQASLPVTTVRPAVMGGLTTATIMSNREALISRMALGDRNNFLPPDKTALIVSYLPSDIDGILDPTEAYAPHGYSIDLPKQRIDALDISAGGLHDRQLSVDSAVVPWLQVGGSGRPFVRLGDGRLALIDTGSSFGLAVNERYAVIVSNRRNRGDTAGTRDIAGGIVRSRRVSPSTITIGQLVLRGVPTDILFGVEDDAPLILGRDALYPFRISFDPRRRLIEFVTSSEVD
jgi:aspartyl protease